MITIKKILEVEQVPNATYQWLYTNLSDKTIVSCPELIQRALMKHRWNNKVIKDYFESNFVFTGASKAQTFHIVSKKSLLDSFEEAHTLCLDDDEKNFLQECIDIINYYEDSEYFIIDGQSRGYLAHLPFFNSEFKWTMDITFVNEETGEEYTKSDFLFEDLTENERTAFLSQEITVLKYTKGTLQDYATLVVGINQGLQWADSEMMWTKWFAGLKFDIKKDIIEILNWKNLFKNVVTGTSEKYEYNRAGYVSFILETIHLLRNLNNSSSKLNFPSSTEMLSWFDKPSLYAKKVELDKSEYKMLKLILKQVSDIQETNVKLPKFANLTNLVITTMLILNKNSVEGQKMLKETFTTYNDKTFIRVENPVEFIKKLATSEVDEYSKDIYLTDSEGKLITDELGNNKKNYDCYHYYGSKNKGDFLIKRKNNILKRLPKMLKELYDKKIISVCTDREFIDYLAVYDQTNKTGGISDMFDRPISKDELLDKSKFQKGHNKSLRKSGTNDITNFTLEDGQVNVRKQAQNY